MESENTLKKQMHLTMRVFCGASDVRQTYFEEDQPSSSIEPDGNQQWKPGERWMRQRTEKRQLSPNVLVLHYHDEFSGGIGGEWEEFLWQSFLGDEVLCQIIYPFGVYSRHGNVVVSSSHPPASLRSGLSPSLCLCWLETVKGLATSYRNGVVVEVFHATRGIYIFFLFIYYIVCYGVLCSCRMINFKTIFHLSLGP